MKLRAGSAAVRCPACPQPGINMDPNWKDRPEDERYKDALFIAKDGNFQLCQHDKKLDENDFSVLDGAAYFVDNQKHEDYKKRNQKDTDVNKEVSGLAFLLLLALMIGKTGICSDFKATNAIKAGRYDGKKKSGVITVVCARHGYALPCGTVDIEKGET